MNKGTSKAEKKQDSRELEDKCWKFLQPFLERMYGLVDRRLVKTLLDLVLVILMHRHRNHGLLLSELGDQLLGERGPAGVKRIASLLHSVKWKSGLILKYLWERGDEKVKELGVSIKEDRGSQIRVALTRIFCCDILPPAD